MTPLEGPLFRYLLYLYGLGDQRADKIKVRFSSRGSVGNSGLGLECGPPGAAKPSNFEHRAEKWRVSRHRALHISTEHRKSCRASGQRIEKSENGFFVDSRTVRSSFVQVRAFVSKGQQHRPDSLHQIWTLAIQKWVQAKPSCWVRMYEIPFQSNEKIETSNLMYKCHRSFTCNKWNWPQSLDEIDPSILSL